MFLELSHTKLNVYVYANELIIECYALVNLLPFEERFNLVQQIKRAALSVKLNIAEGATRKSPQERRRFFEISRGSINEIDTALDIAFGLGYILEDHVVKLGETIIKTFKLLTGLINK